MNKLNKPLIRKLLIILLLILSFIFGRISAPKDNSSSIENAIEEADELPMAISNSNLSESVNEVFKEIDTHIEGHPASFDLFEPVDVDLDGVKEKIYYVPIAMNHGAAEIWIIKDDEVIFKSTGSADRWLEPSEDSNGFYLLEGIQVGEVWNAISKKTRYIYQNDKFIPIWYEEKSNNDNQNTQDSIDCQRLSFSKIEKLAETHPDAVDLKNKYGDSIILEYDHTLDNKIIVFHLYEIVQDTNSSHAATYNWIGVNSCTGEITDF